MCGDGEGEGGMMLKMKLLLLLLLAITMMDDDIAPSVLVGGGKAFVGGRVGGGDEGEWGGER